MVLKQFKEKYEHKAVDHFPTQVKNNPMVSVCVVTYNHVNYIKQCLDGILNQKIDFDVEILLGDDASTDGTREICVEYARKYPDKIKLFLHHRENNIKIGGKPTGRFNFLYNLYSAQGKYIALCDGDDFWTDPLKLQTQVDFLESNEGFVMCYTNCGTVNQKNELRNPKFLPHTKDTVFSIFDLMFVAPTLTRVYRNHDYILSDYTSITAIDAVYLIEQMKFGKAKYLDIVSANYRKHSNGIWSLRSELERKKSHLEVRLYGFKNTEGKVKLNFLKATLRSFIKIRNLDKNTFFIAYNEFKLLYKDIDISLRHRFFLSVFNFLNNFQNVNKYLVAKLQLKLISML
jgi:glycosyltransferase involved in cell wall biosynthesis